MTETSHEGPLGVAHRVPDDVLAASLTGDEVATLAYWWIHTPGTGVIVAHADAEPADVQAVQALEVMVPADPREQMDTFSLGLITLADIPGVPPANKRWPWVTHELLVWTLDTTKRPVAHTDPMPWPLMQPHNVTVQFQVHDDDQAREVASYIVWAIVTGMLPPEIQAYVPERNKMMTLVPLYELWQDTVDTTAEHCRTGGSHDESQDQ